jgi:hypothetical protein
MFREVFPFTWSQKFPGWRAAINVYLRTASLQDRVAAVKEIDLILDSGVDHLSVDLLLSTGLECNFIPSLNGLSSLEWLILLRHELAVV